MSHHRLPSLPDLPHRVRESLADWPTRFRQWRDDLRKDPSLLWRTTAVRILLWLALGTALLVGLRSGINALTPGVRGVHVEEPTPYATLYVACTNPACRHQFVSKQPMDFDDWPLTCPKCGQPTVYRAQLCPVCRQWFATAPGQPAECPFCAERQKATDEPERIGPELPTNPDDAEDPWG